MLKDNKVQENVFFFDDIVDGENDVVILQSFFLPEGRRLKKVHSIIFQQVGAPPHFSNNIMQLLNKHLLYQWIGRRGPIRWFPRSPNLTSLDFLLWSQVKNKVFKTPINDIFDLKQTIDN